MDPAAAKQQIAERVKQASKFLVTVNANPTVDQLAACIGLTLLLNKMGKHATAVFSGQVPNTLEFLQPQKTITNNTDSLRDFIISLDKNKADKLRYKIEDQYVRIFITPYQTSLSQKDLIFSEGDFNVEVVIALGVTNRTQLDQAITAHGRILHDATVISINSGAAKAADLGQINWQDPTASSLCEMLVSISEAFGTGLLDGQMATAFLTGIVAETQRFSNRRTSPKVMTMSAQLMAAGANQQLIVSKLEPPPPPPPPPTLPPKSPPPKGPPPPSAPPKPRQPAKPKPPQPKPEGVLDVSHDGGPDGGEVEVSPDEIRIDEQGNLITDKNAIRKVFAQPPPAAAPLPPVQEPPPRPLESPPPPPSWPSPPPPPVAPPEVPPPAPSSPSAPSQAPPPVMPTDTDGLPPLPNPEPIPQIRPLHHAYLGAPGPMSAANPLVNFAPSNQPDWAAPYDLVPMDPYGGQPGNGNEDVPSGAAMPPPSAGQVDNSVDEIGVDSQTPMPATTATPSVDNARSAVQSAIAAAPFDPAFGGPVQALNAQPLPQAAQPQPAPAMQPTAAGDTPMLVLPTGGAGAVTAAPAPSFAPEPAPPAPVTNGTAPPPVPPPLVPSPGVIIPNPPQQH